MIRLCRPWLFFAVLAGLVLANSCGRSELDPRSFPVGTGTGGTPADVTDTGGIVAATGGVTSDGGATWPLTGGVPSTTGGATVGTGGLPSVTGGVITVSTGGLPSGTGGVIGRGGSTPVGTGGTGGTTRPATGGVGGSATGGTGGGTSGTCSEVPCLAPLLLGCAPAGNCTTQSNTVGMGYAQSDCYANGVKQQTVAKLSGVIVANVTVSQNGATCYSIDATGSISGSTLSYVFRDANGKQVATGTDEISSSFIMVTCDGAQSVTLSDACSSLVGGSGSCATGVCAH